MTPLPRRFERRTIIGVVTIFLVTMVSFLAAAYRSERARYLSEAFRHLEETLAVLPQVSGSVGEMVTALSDLEDRLDHSAGVAHRLLLVDAGDEILASSRPNEVGGDLRSLYRFTPVVSSDDGGATAGRSGEGWLAVSKVVGDAGERLVLMRSRRGELDLLRSFVILHGFHAGVTVLLFVLLLTFLGKRFVRRPIVELADYVGRVEAGRLKELPDWDRDDEFGWLAERFAEMGQRLDTTVRRLVRREKAASAVAVAYRVVRQLAEPLARLQRHIVLLESAATQDPELEGLADDVGRDRRLLVEALVRLEELLPEDEMPDDQDSAGENEREQASDLPAGGNSTASRGDG